MTSTEPGSPATAAVIAAWENSGIRTKQIAALLARELVDARPGDRVDSTAKIAARLGTTSSMAANARNHLTGQQIIRKHGRHYYVA